MRSFTSLADFFLPRFCFGCGKKLSEDQRLICGECLSTFERPGERRLNIEFERKFAKGSSISNFIALFVFEKEKPVQNLFHNLKYGRRYAIGNRISDFIDESQISRLKSWKADLIIPVPLHRSKLIERGFNQSEYIAAGFSRKLALPLMKNILYRVKRTSTQTSLSLKERELNVKDAFAVKRKGNIGGKSIILVDDIITTGATANAAAKILSKSGAKRVFLLAAAIADLSHSFGSGQSKKRQSVTDNDLNREGEGDPGLR